MADAPQPLTNAQRTALDNISRVDPSGQALEVAKLLVAEGNIKPTGSPDIKAAGNSEQFWGQQWQKSAKDALMAQVGDQILAALDNQLAQNNGQGELTPDQVTGLKGLTAGQYRELVAKEQDAFAASQGKVAGQTHSALLEKMKAQLAPLLAGGDTSTYSPPTQTPPSAPAPGGPTPPR